MFGDSKASDSFPKVSCKSPDTLAAMPAGERSFWHGYEQEETINRQADMHARMPARWRRRWDLACVNGAVA